MNYEGVAVWGVRQILEASPKAVQKTAQECFPNIGPKEVEFILENPQRIKFSEDGNTMFIPSE